MLRLLKDGSSVAALYPYPTVLWQVHTLESCLLATGWMILEL
jgi:hypothetical protein